MLVRLGNSESLGRKFLTKSTSSKVVEGRFRVVKEFARSRMRRRSSRQRWEREVKVFEGGE